MVIEKYHVTSLECDHCQIPFGVFTTVEEMLIAILRERKRGEQWIFRVDCNGCLEIYCPTCIDDEVVNC